MKKGVAHCKITEWQVMDKKKDELTLRSTRNFIPPLWYKGEGVDGTPPRICCSILKRFYL